VPVSGRCGVTIDHSVTRWYDRGLSDRRLTHLRRENFQFTVAAAQRMSRLVV